MILLVMLSGILLTPVKINPKNKLCGFRDVSKPDEGSEVSSLVF